MVRNGKVHQLSGLYQEFVPVHSRAWKHGRAARLGGEVGGEVGGVVGGAHAYAHAHAHAAVGSG